MSYLQQVLDGQRVPPQAEDTLRGIRDRLEQVLKGNWKTGDPRFYYGGSFGKRTMIRESFDLDLVVYFPQTNQFTVRAFYEGVEKRLKDNKYITERHNVAIRLPYKDGFHVDVVPGRAMDDDYKYANLYASEQDTTKQTSIKIHIDYVRNGGHQEIIKLMKLWRLRHGVPIGSFALELAIAQALYNSRSTSLEDRVLKVLEYLRDAYASARLVDPANSNNVVSDDVSGADKLGVQESARRSRAQTSWSSIIW
jgi:hypothetical protein